MHEECRNCEYTRSCRMQGFVAETVTLETCPFRQQYLDKQKTEPEYRFNEGELIAKFKEYVDGTYSEHYSTKDVQTFELIRKNPERAFGFLDGNIIKYADRNKGQQRKDYLKIMHYAMLALNELDRTEDA